MMILTATDFSDGAQVALERAARIARARHARLTIVHAFDESTGDGLRSLGKRVNCPLDEELHDRIAKALGDATARIARRWNVRATAVAADGAPAEAVAATARAVRASLVVLGVQGASLSGLPFVGSLLRQAPTDILIVP